MHFSKVFWNGKCKLLKNGREKCKTLKTTDGKFKFKEFDVLKNAMRQDCIFQKGEGRFPKENICLICCTQI